MTEGGFDVGLIGLAKALEDDSIGTLGKDLDLAFGRASDHRHAFPRAVKLEHRQHLVLELLSVHSDRHRVGSTDLFGFFFLLLLFVCLFEQERNWEQTNRKDIVHLGCTLYERGFVWRGGLVLDAFIFCRIKIRTKDSSFLYRTKKNHTVGSGLFKLGDDGVANGEQCEKLMNGGSVWRSID